MLVAEATTGTPVLTAPGTRGFSGPDHRLTTLWGMGIDRSDAWLTALLVICAVLAAVAVAFEIHAARSDEPRPDRGPGRPPPESSPVVATPANPLAEEPAPVAPAPRDRSGAGPVAACRQPLRGGQARSRGCDPARSGRPGGRGRRRPDRLRLADRLLGRRRPRPLARRVHPRSAQRLARLGRADPDKITGGYTDFRIGVDLSGHEAQLLARRPAGPQLAGHGRRTRFPRPHGHVRGDRPLPRWNQPGLRLLRGGAERDPAQSPDRLERRRPHRLPRDRRPARRRRVHRVHPQSRRRRPRARRDGAARDAGADPAPGQPSSSVVVPKTFSHGIGGGSPSHIRAVPNTSPSPSRSASSTACAFAPGHVEHRLPSGARPRAGRGGGVGDRGVGGEQRADLVPRRHGRSHAVARAPRRRRRARRGRPGARLARSSAQEVRPRRPKCARVVRDAARRTGPRARRRARRERRGRSSPTRSRRSRPARTKPPLA